MVNYLNKFILNLSTINKPLRELLEKKQSGIGMSYTERLENLKNILTLALVLKYYDVSADVSLSVNASSFGIGVCLFQNNQPVAYASRAISAAERNYA